MDYTAIYTLPMYVYVCEYSNSHVCRLWLSRRCTNIYSLLITASKVDFFWLPLSKKIDTHTLIIAKKLLSEVIINFYSNDANNAG